MTKKMLIDAAHPEETRVVVVSGNRVEEFDFETLNKKQLKGNIYLAKVTRVEPSLQAAFVDYGGNRHGFLAFSEIHPDYYQIPYEDRLALLQEEAENDREEDDDDSENGAEETASSADDAEEPEADDEDQSSSELGAESASENIADDGLPAFEAETGQAEDSSTEEWSSSEEPEGETPAKAEDAGLEPIEISMPAEAESADESADTESDDGDDLPAAERDNLTEARESQASESAPEEVGAQDAMEELPRRKRRPVRRYKIQEVIRRRQIILVQVVKEERGNKGAALTTYLSLAGRYCVLMPNTDRGGGISRKITSGSDRKRLKDIATDLEVPEGMGLIVRTAGANRTKAELKRDFEYLLRLWESVRELTLQSTAPALVYEEGNLVKRSIRDLYGRDIEGVLVEGAEAYKEAKAFMKMLTPSHAKNVQQYTDKLPLFQRYQVETQLDALYSPRVDLRSGGYIVMNSTEALVAIDVNSGKATREHSIEETALKTNLEAAEEVARQLRLRDLAGLIVIDFIDMEEHRHDRAVERKLKECLKTDRARIQVGRISAFGLLEMSRQRLRASVLEGSTLVCETCDGAGRVPSTEATALRILRALESEGVRGRLDGAHVKAPPEVTLYLLNYKRPMLRQIEERFSLPCYIESSEDMKAGHFMLERAPEGLIDWLPAQPVVSPESGFATVAEEDEVTGLEVEEAELADVAGEAADSGVEEVSEAGEGDGEARRGRRGRRRRGRRGGDREGRERQPRGETEDIAQGAELEASTEPSAEEGEGESSSGDASQLQGSASAEERERKRRRRGRRGGRRNRRRDRDGVEQSATSEPSGTASEAVAESAFAPSPDDQGQGDLLPPEPITFKPDSESAESAVTETVTAETINVPEPEPQHEPEPEPAPPEREEAETGNGHAHEDREEPQEIEIAAETHVHPAGQDEEDEDEDEDDLDRPRRKGWWQRKIFG